MVGTAVAIARGVLPPFAVNLALEAPYHFNFPLAPAQGLSLHDAGFDRNAKVTPLLLLLLLLLQLLIPLRLLLLLPRPCYCFCCYFLTLLLLMMLLLWGCIFIAVHSYCIYTHYTPICVHGVVFCFIINLLLQSIAMSAGTTGNRTLNYLLLMDAAEYTQSEQFYHSSIRARIEADWRNTSDDGELTRWVRFCERFRPSEEVRSEWASLHQKLNETRYCGGGSSGSGSADAVVDPADNDRRRIDLAMDRFKLRSADYELNQRIKAERRKQQRLHMGHMEDAVVPDAPPAAFNSSARRRSQLVPIRRLRHRDFLPRAFATQMVRICYQCYCDYCVLSYSGRSWCFCCCSCCSYCF